MKNNFQFESILKNANGDNKAFLTDTNRRRTAVKPMAVFLFRQVFKKSLSRDHNLFTKEKGSLFDVKIWMKILVKKSTLCYGNKNRNRNLSSC